ncbi:hypothetical protein AT6N2_C3204 [Agrobacterium tumefaciens]|nr:hypothetical protein AT6N2_C3204 [Agrobacterium tumefaciens]
MSPRFRRIQRFGQPLMHDLAAVHDVDVVGKFAAEIQILLDQQDRHAGGIAQIFNRTADILDDRRLNALGRLVEHKDFRPRDQRPADGKLLLLTAGEIAAAARQHGLQHRKQAENIIRDEPLLARQRRITALQIFLNAQQRKDFPALRHVTDAALRPLVRRQPIQCRIAETDRAGAGGLLAGDGAQQRAFSDAVAAENAGDLAHLGLQRHAAQGLRCAVVEVDVVDCQHGETPMTVWWAALPPSALPGISPSRGEIGKWRTLCRIASWQRSERGRHLISPLEGEMPGRAEGAIAANITITAPDNSRSPSDRWTRNRSTLRPAPSLRQGTLPSPPAPG